MYNVTVMYVHVFQFLLRSHYFCANVTAVYQNVLTSSIMCSHELPCHCCSSPGKTMTAVATVDQCDRLMDVHATIIQTLLRILAASSKLY